MKNWESPACNNCGSKRNKVVWDGLITWEHKGIFRVVKCSACGLIYLNPRPTRAKIGNYYPKESYWGRDVAVNPTNADFKKEREYAFGPIYDFVMKHKNKGSILDIGAGTGTFLSNFKELGWKVDGVELSNDAVKFSKKIFKIKLKIGDFFDHSFQTNYYDVATLNNALEHLYNPLETLKRAHKLLKKNGMIIITVPNVDSLGLKIFGKRWHAIQPPRHLYHFSEKTLNEMLNKSGFKTIRTNRWYYAHNYYTIFESFRFNTSPRFKKEYSGGLVNSSYEKKFSPTKETGKIIIKVLSVIIVLLGSSLRRSEIITVYAVKND